MAPSTSLFWQEKAEKKSRSKYNDLKEEKEKQ